MKIPELSEWKQFRYDSNYMHGCIEYEITFEGKTLALHPIVYDGKIQYIGQTIHKGIQNHEICTTAKKAWKAMKEHYSEKGSVRKS